MILISFLFLLIKRLKNIIKIILRLKKLNLNCVLKISRLGYMSSNDETH